MQSIAAGFYPAILTASSWLSKGWGRQFFPEADVRHRKVFAVVGDQN